MSIWNTDADVTFLAAFNSYVDREVLAFSNFNIRNYVAVFIDDVNAVFYLPKIQHSFTP